MADYEKVAEIQAKLTPQYIAGFFDGEGSITVTKDLCIQVVIGQNDEDILIAIANFFGSGTLSAPKIRRGHKQCYVLRWCSKKATSVLERILPYLVLKRYRAELAIKAQSFVVHAHAGKPVPRENREKRELLAKEIKGINDSHWSRRPNNEAVN